MLQTLKQSYVPIILLSIFLSMEVQAQSRFTKTYRPETTRILFLLDGSGSMNETWGGQKKFESSKQLLYHLVDSLERATLNIQFGLRIFGHQYPKAVHNCKDSKLEINFKRGNAKKFKQVLEKVRPQGWTPIAYSLFQAIEDFPNDPKVKNVIVLITDGIENCDGDPCAMATLMQKKRISLKPFIIGLGVGNEGREAFDCVGIYINTASRSGFQNALNIMIARALNTTTVQLNLMDLANQPTETDLEVTFYDAYSKEILYNFVHTFDKNGNSDTLKLDPAAKYDVEVHSIRSDSKSNIELVPGKHNIIAIDAPQGTLKLSIENQVGFSATQCIVREHGSADILYVQDLLSSKRYLVGNYDLEILTLPRSIKENVRIDQSQTTEIQIPIAGSLSITTAQEGILSIYQNIKGEREMFFENKSTTERTLLKIQPGNYTLIYRKHQDANSYLTEVRDIRINSGKYSNEKF